MPLPVAFVGEMDALLERVMLLVAESVVPLDPLLVPLELGRGDTAGAALCVGVALPLSEQDVDGDTTDLDGEEDMVASGVTLPLRLTGGVADADDENDAGSAVEDADAATPGVRLADPEAVGDTGDADTDELCVTAAVVDGVADRVAGDGVSEPVGEGELDVEAAAPRDTVDVCDGVPVPVLVNVTVMVDVAVAVQLAVEALLRVTLAVGDCVGTELLVGVCVIVDDGVRALMFTDGSVR